MDEADSIQLVKHKIFEPIKKTSSLYIKVENFAELKIIDVVSNKIQLLDIDAIWWIAISSKTYNGSQGCHGYPLKLHLETVESIWHSKTWVYSISVSVNGIQGVTSTSNIISKELSTMDKFITERYLYGKSSLELEVVLTILSSKQIKAQTTFVDKTAICRNIIAENKLILSESKYSDFTYIVQGTKFKVNKCILAAASTVFDKVFSAKLEETHTNECRIDDIESSVFQHLLNFIYTKELPESLSEDDLSRKLFEAAHYYQIENLKEACIRAERLKLSQINAEEVYKWAITYDLEDLKMEAWNIIKWEILEIARPMSPLPYERISSLIAKKRKCSDLLDSYRSEFSDYQKIVKQFD